MDGQKDNTTPSGGKKEPTTCQKVFNLFLVKVLNMGIDPDVIKDAGAEFGARMFVLGRQEALKDTLEIVKEMQG